MSDDHMEEGKNIHAAIEAEMRLSNEVAERTFAELRERQKAMAAFEVWAATRIEECRAIVFLERKPSIVINHLLDKIERENRTLHLVEMRILNHGLRILRGEPVPELHENGTFGCRSCGENDACFDGSVECQRKK